MRTLRTHKAQPIISTEPIESVTIVLDEEFPNRHDLSATMRLHEEEGRKLAEVLTDTLAGGTLDALTAELLRRKSVSLIVPRDK